MNQQKEVTVKLPLALQLLITTSNDLLKQYQAKLLTDVEEASLQMMQILKLDPSIGWKLDTHRMIFVRQVEELEEEVSE